MAIQTNYDHIVSMEPFELGNILFNVNVTTELCEICTKSSCDEKCADGISQWLLQPFNPAEPIWKEER